MFDKFVTAIEPFAFTLIILVGANLAGWVEFSNRAIVGIVIVFLGALLVVKHISQQVTRDKKSTK